MRLTRVLSPVFPTLGLVLVAGLHVPARAVTFERTWFGPDGNGNSRGRTVEQTPDGGYVVGADHSENCKKYVCLLKTDSLGDTVWTRAFGGRRYPDSVQAYQCGLACMMRIGGYAIHASPLRQQTAFDVIIFGLGPDGDSLWN
uniref:Uncharacterized protein n=1 Tax=candidate division WOR-3 bacterium TaxID=2052148 RepID=A0A7C4GAD9_UNCW3